MHKIHSSYEWFLPFFLVSSSIINDSVEGCVLGHYSPHQEKHRIFSGAVYLLCYFITKAHNSILRSWIPLELEMAHTWANRSAFSVQQLCSHHRLLLHHSRTDWAMQPRDHQHPKRTGGVFNLCTETRIYSQTLILFSWLLTRLVWPSVSKEFE